MWTRSIERARLLQHGVGDRQLADVVQEAPDGEPAEASWGKPKLLTPCTAECNSTRVSSVYASFSAKRTVSAIVRAEKGFLGGDELAPAQVAGERTDWTLR